MSQTQDWLHPLVEWAMPLHQDQIDTALEILTAYRRIAPTRDNSPCVQPDASRYDETGHDSECGHHPYWAFKTHCGCYFADWHELDAWLRDRTTNAD